MQADHVITNAYQNNIYSESIGSEIDKVDETNYDDIYDYDTSSIDEGIIEEPAYQTNDSLVLEKQKEVTPTYLESINPYINETSSEPYLEINNWLEPKILFIA